MSPPSARPPCLSRGVQASARLYVGPRRGGQVPDPLPDGLPTPQPSVYVVVPATLHRSFVAPKRSVPPRRICVNSPIQVNPSPGSISPSSSGTPFSPSRVRRRRDPPCLAPLSTALEPCCPGNCADPADTRFGRRPTETHHTYTRQTRPAPLRCTDSPMPSSQRKRRCSRTRPAMLAF